MIGATAAVHPGPFTLSDLARLPEDGLRYELIDGSYLVSPPPSTLHQYVASRLVELLNRQIPVDLRAVEGVGIRFAEDRLLIPDVVVAPAAALVSSRAALDPADAQAVFEVVSPSSQRADRLMKPSVYAEAGILLYVRVEPADPTSVSIVVHELAGTTYQETSRAGAGRMVALTIPVGSRTEVSFDPSELLGHGDVS